MHCPITVYYSNKPQFDGTPCAVKVARTVWAGGKVRDNIKDLPISIENMEYHVQSYFKTWLS